MIVTLLIGIFSSFFINMLILSVPSLNYLFEEFKEREEMSDKTKIFINLSLEEKRTVFLLFKTAKYSTIWIILVLLFEIFY